MTINQSGIVKEQETTGQADMDKGQETAEPVDTCKGQETKNNKNDLKYVIFFVSGVMVFIIPLIASLSYLLRFNQYEIIKDCMPYFGGMISGSFLVLIKELFISYALNPKNEVSTLKSFIAIIFIILIIIVILYFTVNTNQHYIDTLTLVVTIFFQNEISVKCWKYVEAQKRD